MRTAPTRCATGLRGSARTSARRDIGRMNAELPCAPPETLAATRLVRPRAAGTAVTNAGAVAAIVGASTVVRAKVCVALQRVSSPVEGCEPLVQGFYHAMHTGKATSGATKRNGATCELLAPYPAERTLCLAAVPLNVVRRAAREPRSVAAVERCLVASARSGGGPHRCEILGAGDWRYDCGSDVVPRFRSEAASENDPRGLLGRTLSG